METFHISGLNCIQRQFQTFKCLFHTWSQQDQAHLTGQLCEAEHEIEDIQAEGGSRYDGASAQTHAVEAENAGPQRQSRWVQRLITDPQCQSKFTPNWRPLTITHVGPFKFCIFFIQVFCIVNLLRTQKEKKHKRN